jgi:hypothetical protein
LVLDPLGQRNRAAPRCVRRARTKFRPSGELQHQDRGIHVSHILHKLDIPTRVEAAAIAHRIASD